MPLQLSVNRPKFYICISGYDGKALKAYKSLSAYQFFEAGWVRSVTYTIVNGCFVFMAKVLHSQKLNEAPLNPWVIVHEDGTVESGHCDCMAGQGSSCSHVAAVLFALESCKFNCEIFNSLGLLCVV